MRQNAIRIQPSLSKHPYNHHHQSLQQPNNNKPKHKLPTTNPKKHNINTRTNIYNYIDRMQFMRETYYYIHKNIELIVIIGHYY